MIGSNAVQKSGVMQIPGEIGYTVVMILAPSKCTHSSQLKCKV